VPTSVLALKISFVLKIKIEDLFVLEETDWK
jgi:DNA-binding XRE family transcriptional regulator